MMRLLIDDSGLQRKLDALEQRVPQALKSLVQQIPYILQPFVAEMLGDAGSRRDLSSADFSSSSRLQTRSGDLLRSLIPGEKWNIWKVKPTSDGIDLEMGTEAPYAAIQDEGGKIKGTERMIRFFWAAYSKSQNDFWRILALSVRSKGYIQIKARPYWGPAMAEFEDDGVDIIIEMIVDELLEIWNAA